MDEENEILGTNLDNPIPKKKQVNFSQVFPLIQSSYKGLDPLAIENAYAEMRRQGVEVVFDEQNLPKEQLNALKELHKYGLSNSKYNFSLTTDEGLNIQNPVHVKDIPDIATANVGRPSAELALGNVRIPDVIALAGQQAKIAGNNNYYIDEQGNIVQGDPNEQVSGWDNFKNKITDALSLSRGVYLGNSLNNKNIVTATNREYYNALYKSSSYFKNTIDELYKGDIDKYFEDNDINPNATYIDKFGNSIFTIKTTSGLIKDASSGVERHQDGLFRSEVTGGV